MNPSRFPVAIIFICGAIMAVVFFVSPPPIFFAPHLTPYNGSYGYAYHPFAPLVHDTTSNALAVCTIGGGVGVQLQYQCVSGQCTEVSSGGEPYPACATSCKPITKVTSVTVSCLSPIVGGATSTCTAVVNGTGNPKQSVTWSVISGGVGGTIKATGIYTAPSKTGIDTINATSTQDPTQGGTAQITIQAASAGNAIPGSFFGLVVGSTASLPIQVPYGMHRIWDDNASWPDLETASNSWNWAPFNTWLQDIKNEGNVTDVLYTLMRTPSWADTAWQAANPSLNTNCDYYAEEPGACGYWPDLNLDGTGSNLTWDDAVAEIANHAMVQYKAGKGPHIDYWGIWDELERSTTLTSSTPKNLDLSWEGSYNQLVRMYEDAQCIITGKIQTITTNNSESCSALRAAVDQATGLSLTAPIDPSAQIESPAAALSGSVTNQSIYITSNFLYCNDNPPAGTCTTGREGADAVDVIGTEFYVQSAPIETAAVQRYGLLKSILQGPEQTKPIFLSEGSWGGPSVYPPNYNWTYVPLQVSVPPRWFLMLRSEGLVHAIWYSYDKVTGQLYASGTGLNPAGVAYEQTYKWMVGATLVSPCSNTTDSIWTCELTRPGGYQAEAIWDANSTCSATSCTTSQASIPAGVYTQSLDLTGTSTSIGAGQTSVTVSLQPILIENQSIP